MRKILLAIFIAYFSTTAHAFYHTGNDLIHFYKEKKKIDASNQNADSFLSGVYGGYVIGVTDALVSRRMICPPQNVPISQVAEIVGKYLEDYPKNYI
jgi:hypothetical protein